ncbi:MAG: hypothetical protein RI894_8 [Bacteroidota bacterium]|jgi:hypothetical protein
MSEISDETVINHTQNWIKDVVIACNFCPFAASALLKNKIRYRVLRTKEVQTALEAVLQECALLDEDEQIETTLLIFPTGFDDFDAYLDLVAIAEELLIASNYEGEYQVASFHPNYLFAEVEFADPANYTNRSVYPMLHLLREASVENAINTYPNAAEIPDKNVAFARKKGLQYMQQLRTLCLR